jgi:hypothetical protein
VSKLKEALELDLAPDLAAAACRETFRELDWEVLVDEGAVIAAREDATRLSCRRWPARTELRIARGEHGGAVISIETDRSPVAGRVRRQAGVLDLDHVAPAIRLRAVDVGEAVLACQPAG